MRDETARSTYPVSVITIIGVSRAQVASEKLLVLGDVGLGDHILNRGGDFVRGNTVDTAKSETKNTVTDTLLELVGDSVGNFDRLLVDIESADNDSVGTDGAGGIRNVAVNDPP